MGLKICWTCYQKLFNKQEKWQLRFGDCNFCSSFRTAIKEIMSINELHDKIQELKVEWINARDEKQPSKMKTIELQARALKLAINKHNEEQNINKQIYEQRKLL